MATVKNIRDSKRYKNYVSALVAINKSGEALETFTEHCLHNIHQHIQQNLGYMTACTRQCSNVERDFNRWCPTCIHWKAELEKWLTPVAKTNRTKLSKLHSWEWLNNARAIAEIFIFPGWDANSIDLKDLSTTLAIWNRCTWFPGHLVTLGDQLRKNRNEVVHNTAMSLTKQRKNAIFQNIRNVVNHQDVQQFIPYLPAFLQELQALEQGDLFSYENDIDNALRIVAVTNKNINTKIDRVALGLTQQHNVMRNVIQRIDKMDKTTQQIILCTTVFPVCAHLLLFMFMFIFLKPNGFMYSCSQENFESSNHDQLPRNLRLLSTDGCLSERSASVAFGNVSLFEYLSHHNKFSGREWLFKILMQEVERHDRQGVLLEANMGYGKSALIAHIICANNNSVYKMIRKQLVAFHVCRFDVLMSKQVHIFIFRLLAMISRQIPELDDNIRTCQQTFNKKSCEKDPNGCLDHCIIFPLKNIKYMKKEPYVIALDALDECHDLYRKENPIFLLLKHRIHQFPYWIKFVITSRYHPEIRELERDLTLVRLEHDDENNRNDILIYLNEWLSNTSAKHVANNINNFLIATSVNEGYMDGLTIPKTLDRYYEDQFIREFGEGVRFDFDSARYILEVLCSLFQATDKQLILNILSYSKNYTEIVLNKTLERLHNFLRIIHGKYHLSHFSVKQWLTTTKSQRFNLNVKNGHTIIARYFLSKTLNDTKSVNIVDVCIHVGLSLDADLRKEFLKLSNIESAYLEQSGVEYPLFELAKRIDSGEIMNLLTSLFKNIDRKDANSMTATFIAASFGHLTTMQALLERGADITARTDTFQDIINLDVAFAVSFEYQYWGYGILDIAAQNGHSHIVDFILSNNGKLYVYPMTRMNSMMLLPIHLACKRGHFIIVKHLFEKFPWMLDWQCLYYASEIGHSEMVELILNANISDECRPCQEYLHWIPKDSVRVQGQVVPSNLRNGKYVLFDDWLNITCESALHVAVRRDQTDIVKMLVKQIKNALHCQDRGGRTPVISAVQYGHHEIVDVFLVNGLLNHTETCGKGNRLNDALKLHRNEIIRIQEYFCEEGNTVLHIASKFDRYSFFENAIKLNYSINWNVRNSEGCHIIHQAACYSSMNTLFYFKKINLIGHHRESFYQCKNGSTPLQFAIVCGSAVAVEFLLKYSNFYEKPIDIKFSYLILAVAGDFSANLVDDVYELENKITAKIRMLITEDLILRHNDKTGRNIFYYAISNGHFGVLSFLVSNHSSISQDCLLNRDADKKNSSSVCYRYDKTKARVHHKCIDTFGHSSQKHFG